MGACKGTTTRVCLGELVQQCKERLCKHGSSCSQYNLLVGIAYLLHGICSTNQSRI